MNLLLVAISRERKKGGKERKRGGDRKRKREEGEQGKRKEKEKEREEEKGNATFDPCLFSIFFHVVPCSKLNHQEDHHLVYILEHMKL